MSLIRKGSKAALRISTEDFTSSMDQKNAIIASLQAELDSLRMNQEKYDRVKQELLREKGRYESLLRQSQTCRSNNQERLELSARSVCELRMQAQTLADELKLRMNSLKEAKFRSQQLVDFHNQKEEETSECNFKLQQLKNTAEMRVIEQERSRVQSGQVREEVEKGRRQIYLIKSQTEDINEKCYKSQGYIRNLLREESNINEMLTKVESENSILETNIAELETAISINQGQICNKERDCQQLQFTISSRQLERRKIQNEIKQKVKILSAEKQKWRSLCEQWEQAKSDSNRLDNLIDETSTQINFIIAKNNEILDVNEQLTQDLKVCQRHLDNVSRVNKCLECEIKCLHETNLKAICKLRQPFSSRSNGWSGKSNEKCWKGSEEWETGDFQKAWR